mgnify:CR=1 FL=1
MVSYRSLAIYGNGNATSATGPYPTGTATGDYVLVQLYKENDGAVTKTPSDLVLVQEGDNNTTDSFHSYLYIRKFTSGDANVNLSWTGSVWRDMQITSWQGSSGTGADGTDGTPSVQISSSNGTSFTCPSITTAIADSVLACCAFTWAGVNYTDPDGASTEWTDRGTDGRDCHLSSKATAVAAGSQGAQTVTGSASTSWVGMQVAIKNADASAGAANFRLALQGVG